MSVYGESMASELENPWLTVSAGFALQDTDAAVAAFMTNVRAAADTMLRGTTGLGWDDDKLDELYVVLTNVPGATEPVVTRVPGVPKRIRMYSASYHWTTEEFHDPRSGPWRLLSHVALILAGLNSDGVERIPALVASAEEEDFDS